MTLASNGNLGIGTDTPLSTLHVNGDIRASLSNVSQANLVAYNTSTGLFTYLSTSSFATTNIYNSDGTLTGNRIVDLDANNLTFTATEDESIVFNHTSGGTFEIKGFPTIQTTGEIQHVGSAYFSGSNTNVGIGTVTPLSKLAISQNTDALGSGLSINSTSNYVDKSAIHINSTSTGTGAGITFENRGINTAWIGHRGSSSNALHFEQENGDFVFAAGTYAQLIGHTVPALVTIKNGGNVGIGTASPLAKLGVHGDIVVTKTTTAFSSFGGPVLSLGDSTSEVGMAGGIAFTELLTTGAKNVTMGIYYDGNANKMHFTGPSDAQATAGENLIAATKHMTITRDVGNVGIGTATPLSKLHVNGDIRATLSNVNQVNAVMYNSGTGLFTYVGTGSIVISTAANADNIFVSEDATNANQPVLFASNTEGYYRARGDKADFTYNPATNTLTAGTYIETSALKFKENIVHLTGSLHQVEKLQGVSYNRIGQTHREIGLIADEVVKILPELVKYQDGQVYGLSYNRITAVLVEAVKELSDKVKQQEIFIQDLADRLKKQEDKG
jgi:hypothetical protein